MSKKALVICPGRGTYNKDELGYFHRHHSDKKDLITAIDTYRAKQGQTKISALDNAEKYSMNDHTRGDNASALIYACAYGDFLSINRDKFDIIAATGNSMGWYITLACGDAVTPDQGTQIINTMGTLMHEQASGGQIIYPLVDENWRPINGRREFLLSLTHEIDDLYISIYLGGLIVFAGSDEALQILTEKLPPEQGRFPLRLPNHGAFHTPLMSPIAAQGRERLPAELLGKPSIPLIDGRGAVWSPYSTNPKQIWDYTFDHQVCKTYDFTRAVQVSVREFTPDCIIILGPGNTLGGAVAQCLLEIEWRGMKTKEDFTAQQKTDPFIISMNLDEQRKLVTG